MVVATSSLSSQFHHTQTHSTLSPPYKYTRLFFPPPFPPPRHRSLHSTLPPPRASLSLFSKPPPDKNNNNNNEDNKIENAKFGWTNKKDISFADFTRLINDDTSSDEISLQTAVLSFRKKFPWSLFNPSLQVDLVSTIHIADQQYFESLQKKLEKYDCVLYEMITDKERLQNRRMKSGAKKGRKLSGGGFDIVSLVQRFMAGVLQLDFQLDYLEYETENWYNADLDIETFEKLQRERGEDLFSFASEVALESERRGQEENVESATPENPSLWRTKLLEVSRWVPMPLLGLFIINVLCADDKDKSLEDEDFFRLGLSEYLKVGLARQLTSKLTQILIDVDTSSVIVGERNRAALQGLRTAIDEGHTKIAILYGSGHMPDLARRLREEFNLVPSGVQWLTAWTIRKQSSGSIPTFMIFIILIALSVFALDLWFWKNLVETAVDWGSHYASVAAQYVGIRSNV